MILLSATDGQDGRLVLEPDRPFFVPQTGLDSLLVTFFGFAPPPCFFSGVLMLAAGAAELLGIPLYRAILDMSQVVLINFHWS